MNVIYLRTKRDVAPAHVRIGFAYINGRGPNIRTVVAAAKLRARFYGERMFVFEAVKPGVRDAFVVVSEANLPHVNVRTHRLGVICDPAD